MSLDSDFDYPRCVFCEVAYGSPECQECPEYEGPLDEAFLGEEEFGPADEEENEMEDC